MPFGMQSSRNIGPLSIGAARVALLVAFLALWQGLSEWSPAVAFFAARPTDVARALWSDTVSGPLAVDLAITFGAAAGGLVVGVTSALLAAIALAIWRSLHALLSPFLAAMGAVPVVALAPLLILAFGTGPTLEFSVATVSVFLVVLGQAHEGLSESRQAWDELGIDAGVSRSRFYRLVLIPGAASWIFAGMRSSVAFAILGAFIGEFISSERGIGRYVLRNAALYDAARVMAGLTLVAIAALAITAIVDRLQRRLLLSPNSLSDTS